MRLFVFGDYITVNSFALVGIQGSVLEKESSPSEVIEAIEERLRDEDIGLIIYSSFIREIVGEQMEKYSKLTRPLFLEVPETGKEIDEDELQKYIQQVIGIKI